MNVPGRVLFIAALAATCGTDEPGACDLRLVHSPTGTLHWTDGVLRLPDRIYVYRERDAAPVSECSFEPPLSGEEAIAYACPESYAGPGLLSVLLDRERWDTPFEVEYEGCHAASLTIDLELDPAAGTPW